MLTISCNNSNGTQSSSSTDGLYAKGTFGYDIHFLQQYDDIVILSNGEDSARVVVSPKYQAKVFTSSADGNEGNSFGWINYKAFTAKQDEHMNAYGGENRFWLGPEGGVYSLFFPKGSAMEFIHWKTPAAFDTEVWSVTSKKDNAVSLEKDMILNNYAGADLHIKANRTITILTQNRIADELQIALPNAIKAVGYEAQNSITNNGKEAWNEQTGMPCIWMLDMFNPSPQTVIAIPYKTEGAGMVSRIATTNYFGEIPADRIKYHKGTLLFKADGRSRGKLGINPLHAERFAGSYDAQNKVLTLAHFDVDEGASYLNQEWNTTKPPFSGDAVNAYNDGPLADGSQMGPFYEIESVSPAAMLKPDQSLSHNHYVFHFTGNEQSLDAIAQKLLHVSINEMKQAF